MKYKKDKKKVFAIRLSDEEKKNITKQAIKEKLTKSAWVRKKLNSN